MQTLPVHRLVLLLLLLSNGWDEVEFADVVFRAM